MEFDPAAASPCFVNAPRSDQPSADRQIFDAWGSPDEFAGAKPKACPDVFNPVDFSDYEFLHFAKNEFRKPRKIIKQNFNDRLFGDRENFVGTSDDE